jgi:hypothetical protein
VLAPIVIEFLFGSTHITTFYLLLPQIGVYGCSALIIRALARSLRRSWVAILLMGLAFAVVLECLILQTGLAPLFVAADPQHIYGRALGVNWVYLLFEMGYESIWAIVIPIQLTELLFPNRRNDPWLGKGGLVVASVVFVLASAGTWYLWGQAVHKLAKGPAYQAPPQTIALAVAAVVVLFVVALGPWTAAPSGPKAERRAPRPWVARLVAFWLAVLWFIVVIFSVGVAPAIPAVAPVAFGLLLAAVAYGVVSRWSASIAWQDIHRLALISGALYASMLLGFLASGIRLPIDVVGKLVLNVLAIVGISYLARMIRRRKPAPVPSNV